MAARLNNRSRPTVRLSCLGGPASTSGRRRRRRSAGPGGHSKPPGPSQTVAVHLQHIVQVMEYVFARHERAISSGTTTGATVSSADFAAARSRPNPKAPKISRSEKEHDAQGIDDHLPLLPTGKHDIRDDHRLWHEFVPDRQRGRHHEGEQVPDRASIRPSVAGGGPPVFSTNSLPIIDSE